MINGDNSGGENNENEDVTFFLAPQVVAIYEKHNPEKLNSVDQHMVKYKGRWDVLLKVSPIKIVYLRLAFLTLATVVFFCFSSFCPNVR